MLSIHLDHLHKQSIGGVVTGVVEGLNVVVVSVVVGVEGLSAVVVGVVSVVVNVLTATGIFEGVNIVVAVVELCAVVGVVGSFLNGTTYQVLRNRILWLELQY